MEERKYRKYTEAFKLEALVLLKTSQKRAGQIERELGITPGLLSKWRVRYQAEGNGQGTAHLVPSELEAAQAEIRRLQRKLTEVEAERDILKKAVNIFSRTNS